MNIACRLRHSNIHSKCLVTLAFDGVPGESFKGMIKVAMPASLCNMGYSACYSHQQRKRRKLDPTSGYDRRQYRRKYLSVDPHPSTYRGSGAKGGVASALTLRAPSEDCH
jgi:hypothetical protein